MTPSPDRVPKGLVITPLAEAERRRFAAKHGRAGARVKGGAVVITADDASLLEDAVTLTRRLYQSKVRNRQLLQHFLAPAEEPSAAEILQLQRNAEARRAFLSEFGALTSKQLAEMVGSRASNRAALANRWKAQGRIFAVDAGGQRLFPAFQFAEDGQPRAAIAEVLAAFGRKASGWQTALWFAGANGWLGGKRPVDLLGPAPEAVAETARRESETFD
jgi:hypothetical protein